MLIYIKFWEVDTCTYNYNVRPGDLCFYTLSSKHCHERVVNLYLEGAYEGRKAFYGHAFLIAAVCLWNKVASAVPSLTFGPHLSEYGISACLLCFQRSVWSSNMRDSVL